MSQSYKILAINPGSTSTKIAIFEDDKPLHIETIEHSEELLKEFLDPQSQLPFRTQAVLDAVGRSGLKLEDISLFSGRGGGLLGTPGGTYEVDEKLLDHASKGMPGQHPAQLGSQIASALAKQVGGRAFVVNSPDTDELDDLARVTGLGDIFRRSAIHALNQKEIAIRYCSAEGVRYEDVNLIICHIGGGLSVTAHKRGRMVDSNNILGGDGPMAPTRAGTLPALQLLGLCFSGKFTQKELQNRLTRAGGFLDHLGTADAKEVERRIDSGDKYAELVYNAMIYQIAQSVGAMASVLKGEAKAIILTGGISKSERMTGALKEYISWIAPVAVMAGEFEMEALAAGALRVARGEEAPKKYTGVPIFTSFDHLKKKG